MKKLTELPNIGTTLAKKLNSIGIKTEQDLKNMESEKISTQIPAHSLGKKLSAICIPNP